MSHQIYKNRQFKIYETLDGYIVHNSNKEFKYGHTHITNFDTAKYLVYLSIHTIVPKRFPDYLMISLVRLSDDLEYINKLTEKLQKGGYSMSCSKGGKKCSTAKKGGSKKSSCKKKSPKN